MFADLFHISNHATVKIQNRQTSNINKEEGPRERNRMTYLFIFEYFSWMYKHTITITIITKKIPSKTLSNNTSHILKLPYETNLEPFSVYGGNRKRYFEYFEGVTILYE